jgi:hypothetical protein
MKIFSKFYKKFARFSKLPILFTLLGNPRGDSKLLCEAEDLIESCFLLRRSKDELVFSIFFSEFLHGDRTVFDGLKQQIVQKMKEPNEYVKSEPELRGVEGGLKRRVEGGLREG